MDLQGLETYLTGLGLPLTLAGDDARLPAELRAFLAAAPNARIGLTGGGAALVGSVLTISGPSGDTWPVQGLTGVTIAVDHVTITLTQDGRPPVAATAHGRLPLTASVTAPVTLTSSQAPYPGAWEVALTADVPGVAPLDLLLLGKPGRTSPFPVPRGLDPLAAATVIPQAGFGITFYPGTAFEAFLTFTAPLPAVKWTIIPAVPELDGVELRAAVSTSSFSVVLAVRVDVGSVPMEIGIGMRPATHWYAYLKPTGTGSFPGLAALAAWIAGTKGATDATSAFGSAGLNISDFDLAIQAVEVGFDWRTPALDYLQITSRLKLGALEFDVLLRLPDVEVRGTLHAGQPVPLTDVLASYGLPTANVPAALTVTAAEFDGRLTAGSYLARLTVDHVWSAGPLDIAEVGVVADYDRGLTGAVHGVIDLGPSLHLLLFADYDSTAGGWTFSGSTTPGSRLDIGDLVKKLGDAFGVRKLPEALTSLALTDLDVSYETSTGAFTFTCSGEVSLAEVPVRLVVAVGVPAPPAGGGERAVTFDGSLTVPVPVGGGTFNLYFDAHFAKDVTGRRFAASYSHSGADPTPDVKSLVAVFSPSAATYIPEGIAVNVRDVVFALDQPATGRAYLFGVDIGATIDFAKLPLVGDHLTGNLVMGVNPLRILAASAAVNTAEVTELNALLPDKITKLAQRDVAAGFAVDATLQLGGLTQPLALPVRRGTQGPRQQQPTPGPTPTQAQTADDVKWVKIQRTFGPVQIARIGLAYRTPKERSPRIAFLIDGSISVAGLTLSLNGLAIELSVADLAALPSFGLAGLGLSYTSGPVQIGGAFLNGEIVYKDKTYPAYSGSAQIKSGELGLAALGSYTQLPEGPSLFVYAYLDYPIGGPPVFFVRGLAAGFGYNRRLVPPAIDDIPAFPLVAEAVGGRPAGASLADELAKLAAYLPPSVGDYFLTVGVHFTSFQMIDSFVLLAVTFGHRFEVDVLGLSTLILPAPDAAAGGVTPIAEVQLALRAAFVPDDGYLSIAAQLTRDSFLLSRDCHLTGGFAFSTWFKARGEGAGEGRAGDFVVSVGGYHPHVPVPAYYPTVPRLGFSWQVTPQLSLGGSAYFALTPAALMAGGTLKATWQDDSLHAWFDASMDFLIAWQPYHYQATLHVSVGATYTFSLFGTHTVTAHAGADVSLWGPDFAGTAAVDLTVVSFTIAFNTGTSSSGTGDPQPVKWSRFQAAMLPEPDKIVTIALRGDTRQPAPPDDTGLGVVDPAGLVLVTDCSVPSTAGACRTRQSALPVGAADTSAGVGPAGIGRGGMTSTHRITITRDGASAEDAFVYEPVLKNLPYALWGGTLKPQPGDPRLIADMLTGYTIRPMPPREPSDPPWADRAALQRATPLYEVHGAIRLETPAPVTVSQDDAARREAAIARDIAGSQAARAAVVAAVLPGAEVDLTGFDAADFMEIPQVVAYV
ncbi:DUF6603 domain-containing protein [Nonomuraea sp. NPDC050536]|uniref:DUF6603 domain-containing protein n=1 Tax=Nonomuraea sp. NPDC050536 TaxID=3364366 RepID=UPI0037C9CDC5